MFNEPNGAAPPADATIAPDGLWAQPIHWYYATGKLWQGPVAYGEDDDAVLSHLDDVRVLLRLLGAKEDERVKGDRRAARVLRLVGAARHTMRS